MTTESWHTHMCMYVCAARERERERRGGESHWCLINKVVNIIVSRCLL